MLLIFQKKCYIQCYIKNVIFKILTIRYFVLIQKMLLELAQNILLLKFSSKNTACHITEKNEI